MSPGETRRLWIPESLAYKGQPGRPAGMLVFDVTLYSFVATPKPPPVPVDVKAPPADAEVTASGLASKVRLRFSSSNCGPGIRRWEGHKPLEKRSLQAGSSGGSLWSRSRPQFWKFVTRVPSRPHLTPAPPRPRAGDQGGPRWPQAEGDKHRHRQLHRLARLPHPLPPRPCPHPLFMNPCLTTAPVSFVITRTHIRDCAASRFRPCVMYAVFYHPSSILPSLHRPLSLARCR